MDAVVHKNESDHVIADPSLARTALRAAGQPRRWAVKETDQDEA